VIHISIWGVGAFFGDKTTKASPHGDGTDKMVREEIEICKNHQTDKMSE